MFLVWPGHRTRYVNKITSLLDLQEAKYSKVTEATLLNYVHHVERYQDRLNIFLAWLTLHQSESAEVHTEEAENLEVDTTALAERVLEGIHNYVPPPATPAIPIVAYPSAPPTASAPRAVTYTSEAGIRADAPGMPGVNSGLRRQPSLRAPNKKVAPNATAPKPFACLLYTSPSPRDS